MSLRLYNTRTRCGRTVRAAARGPGSGLRLRLDAFGRSASRSRALVRVLRRPAALPHASWAIASSTSRTSPTSTTAASTRPSRLGLPWHDVVEVFYASFKRSMERLRVLEPDREPRATEFIPRDRGDDRASDRTRSRLRRRRRRLLRRAFVSALRRAFGTQPRRADRRRAHRRRRRQTRPARFRSLEIREAGRAALAVALGAKAARAGTSSARRCATCCSASRSTSTAAGSI